MILFAEFERIQSQWLKQLAHLYDLNFSGSCVAKLGVSSQQVLLNLTLNKWMLPAGSQVTGS